MKDVNYGIYGKDGGVFSAQDIATSGGRFGVRAKDATIEVSRLSASNCDWNGVELDGPQAVMTISDLRVSGCQTGGVYSVGGDLTVERAELWHNADAALWVNDGDASVSQLAICETQPVEAGSGFGAEAGYEGWFGYGVVATNTVTLHLYEAELVGNHDASILGVGHGTRIFTDSVRI